MATDVSIKLGVDGEKEFKSALSGVNSQIKNLNAEMKTVTSSFKTADDAEAAIEQRTDILGRTVDATKKKIQLLSTQYDKATDKLDDLSKELEDVKQEFGENSEQAAKAQNAYNRQAKAVNDLGTQLNNAKTSLNNLEREMEDVVNGADKATKALKKTADESEEAGASLKEAFTAGAVAGGIQTIVSSLTGLIETTSEYRKIMASLEVSSTKAGYTAEQTTASYKQLYGVLGDDQTASTTLANLQALGLGQAELTEMIDATIGAWATYGDSIPIDGLAESINETIKAGSVTGTFADVLNWAGTSEDKFNEKLEKCKTQTQRVNLVTKELSKQGLAQTAAAWRENNQDIIETNEASAELTEIWAKLSKKIAPNVAKLKKTFAEALLGITEYTEEHEVLAATVKSTGVAIAAFYAITKGTAAVTPLITAVRAASAAATAGKSAFTAFAASLETNPYLLAGAAIATVVTVLGTLIYKNYQASQSLGELGDAVKENAAAWNEMSAASKQAAEDSITQIEQGAKYISELQRMTDANGKVSKAESDRAAGLYTLIEELLPGMVQKTGEGEKATYKFADSIDELIQKQKALAVYEAYKDDYTEAIKQKADGTKALVDLYAERNELEEKYAQALTTLNDGELLYYGELLEKNEKSIQAQLELNESYDQTIKKVESLNEAIQSKDWESASKLINDFGLSVGELKNMDSDSIIAEYKKVTSAIEELQKQLESGNLSESQRNELQAMLEKLQGFLPEYEEAMKNVGSGGVESYSIGMKSQEEKAQSTALGVVQQVTEALESEKEDAKNAGIQNLAAFIAGAESKERDAATAGEFVSMATNNAMIQMKNDFGITGTNLIDGLIAGINTKVSAAVAAAKNLASKIKSAIQGKDGFDTHSPSRWAREIGIYVMTGLAKGFDAGTDTVINAAENATTEIKRLITKNIEEISDEIAKLEEKIAKETVENNAKQLKNQQEAEKAKLQTRLEALQEFQKEYENTLSEIEKKEESLTDKLKDYGELFTVTKTETSELFSLGDLEKDIDAITRYGEALEELKSKGTPDSLIDEVLSMGIDDATKYISKLNQMTDKDYDEYINLWEEKQQKAAEIAARFYTDEKNALVKEFAEKVPEELSEMKNDMYTIGKQTVDGMTQGMLDRSGNLYSTARNIISQAISAMRLEADIHSPSKKTGNLVGKPMAQGIANKFIETMQKSRGTIASAMMSPITTVNRTDIYNAAESAVNGFAAVGSGAASMQTVVIPVNLDGRQIAEVVYNPLKDIKKRKGEK